MTTIKYSSLSLYNETPQVTNFGINYLDFWNPPLITSNVTDTLITLAAKYDKRPDLLSYDYYQTPEYWWVFMRRNPDIISDPIFDFKTGITIFVPDKSNLPKGIF